MVQAKVHTDDYALEVAFDATPYLRAAPPEAIRALIECGFGGDYPADRVAEHFEDSNQDIKGLFDYLTARNRASRDRIGFEVRVDEHQAEEYLHRSGDVGACVACAGSVTTFTVIKVDGRLTIPTAVKPGQGAHGHVVGPGGNASFQSLWFGAELESVERDGRELVRPQGTDLPWLPLRPVGAA